ncbi:MULTISPECIES: magnesium transporter CorA family protein [Actinoplanes]|uniref:magnesium transporter CorA family protein n=1 Tax=Actinoplanes TaxID=1865 RepID=UPI0005F2C49D|nr:MULTISPECIES: magnesium transporter CorA family protein [Actinoplanes]GLY05736.1 magnesium transporter CorA [Actinoplanes sp. NBRC 101535]
MTTRLFDGGRVIAEDFPAEQVADRLREHPGAVAWLDLFDPDEAELSAVTSGFGLHPLAVEDAVDDHERPKLDVYPDHLFLNVYATRFTDGRIRKIEISAFVLDRALITVHKSAGDLDVLTARWDADTELGRDGGVAFLVYGLLDTVVDSQLTVARSIDAAIDGIEEDMLAEGGAPRAVRRHAYALRTALAALHRSVAPMPEVLAGTERTDLLAPYYRDVEDHAHRALEVTGHARNRITELLDADLAEQGNVLNDVTRKLAAWAAIITVPTALTGYFGQNVPYPGYGQWWGFLLSGALIVLSATVLYIYLKRRGWL